MFIPITKPCYDGAEYEALRAPLETGWLVQGPMVAAFERRFAEFTGAAWARAASSCTAALHLALEALGIGEGDRVIVPSFTYIASANAVEYTGARVVFCDVELSSFNIDLDMAERLLEQDSGRTIRAMMPVHSFGLCADMPRILSLARRFDLRVVEDAACGVGARIGAAHAGTFGDAGCFSFHPRKSLTTGEGGMVTGGNEAVAGVVASLRDHGAGKSDLERHSTPGGSLLPGFARRGYNYRMTDLQGALGVAQMAKIDWILDRKSRLAARYDRALEGLDFVIAPSVPPGYTHGYQAYVCLFTGGEDLQDAARAMIDRQHAFRNRVMARLEAKGIATRQGTHAIHTLEYYRSRYGLHAGQFPRSYAADRLSLALPLFPTMTDEESDQVVEGLVAAHGEG